MLTEIQDRLEAPFFGPIFQPLREKWKYLEYLFSEVRTFGDLNWRCSASKAVGFNFGEYQHNEITAESNMNFSCTQEIL